LIGDYDNDNIADLMVKFNRQEIITYLGSQDFEDEIGYVDDVQFTISGLINGNQFIGNDWIRILKKNK
jgi:hypothetical protein